MYLTCPHCETVYTVRAAMLKEGQGEVRCGACRTLFNALDYLSDELPAAAEPAIEDDVGDPATSEPTQQLTAPADSETPMVDIETDIPAVFKTDWQTLERQTARPKRNIGMSLLALALLVGLGAQYLWFAPSDVIKRFPQSAPYVQKVCQQIGCRVAQRRDPSKFQMLSRDVRVHPRYEGALLVSATFSNAAAFAQPYPRLQFRLYDVTGTTIASRVFEPSEYLATTIVPDAQLPPAQPLQVALEMLAPEQAAVSFEFSFL